MPDPDSDPIDADEELFAILHHELRSMAARAMVGQPAEHTLQPTALVNEAYLRLMSAEGEPFRDRTHFLAVAARAMRHLLVDHARKKNSGKRMPNGDRVGLGSILASFEESSEDLEALDFELEKLAKSDPKMALAIELRYFGGADVKETAEAVGMSERTFQRQWQLTRHYLRSKLRNR